MSIYDERNNIILVAFLLIFVAEVVYAMKKRQEGDIAAAHTAQGLSLIFVMIFMALALLDHGRGLLQHFFIPLVIIVGLLTSIIRRGKI